MSGDIRVLVGDDDVHDRYFMERGFRQVCPDVRVEFLQSGQEVIQYFEDTSHSSIDLLILDSMMPKIDGFVVLSWLRSRKEYEKLPIVMLSGNSYPKNIEKAGELGATEFVKKPEEVFELTKLIDKWRVAYLTKPS